MKFGVVFPQLEIGDDPAVIREYAVRAEDLGFDHLACFDHVAGAAPRDDDPRVDHWPAAAYRESDTFHEPFTLFSYLATICPRLELVTGILILPQRQTVLVAKQAAEVDILSAQRLRLGVGIGWNYLEYEALGVPWRRRGPRLSEQIEVLRRLWDEPVVDFEGEFHNLPRLGIDPRPRRPIPIWTGANSAPGLRRAARLADGVISQLGAAHRALPLWVDDVRAALDSQDRDPVTFGIEGRVDTFDRGDEEVIEDIGRWGEVGATHVSVNTMTPPKFRHRPSPPAWHLEEIERFHRLAAQVSNKRPASKISSHDADEQ